MTEEQRCLHVYWQKGACWNIGLAMQPAQDTDICTDCPHKPTDSCAADAVYKRVSQILIDKYGRIDILQDMFEESL